MTVERPNAQERKDQIEWLERTIRLFSSYPYPDPNHPDETRFNKLLIELRRMLQPDYHPFTQDDSELKGIFCQRFRKHGGTSGIFGENHKDPEAIWPLIFQKETSEKSDASAQSEVVVPAIRASHNAALSAANAPLSTANARGESQEGDGTPEQRAKELEASLDQYISTQGTLETTFGQREESGAIILNDTPAVRYYYLLKEIQAYPDQFHFEAHYERFRLAFSHVYDRHGGAEKFGHTAQEAWDAMFQGRTVTSVHPVGPAVVSPSVAAVARPSLVTVESVDETTPAPELSERQQALSDFVSSRSNLYSMVIGYKDLERNASYCDLRHAFQRCCFTKNMSELRAGIEAGLIALRENYTAPSRIRYDWDLSPDEFIDFVRKLYDKILSDLGYTSLVASSNTEDDVDPNLDAEMGISRTPNASAAPITPLPVAVGPVEDEASALPEGEEPDEAVESTHPGDHDALVQRARARRDAQASELNDSAPSQLQFQSGAERDPSLLPGMPAPFELARTLSNEQLGRTVAPSECYVDGAVGIMTHRVPGKAERWTIKVGSTVFETLQGQLVHRLAVADGRFESAIQREDRAALEIMDELSQKSPFLKAAKRSRSALYLAASPAKASVVSVDICGPWAHLHRIGNARIYHFTANGKFLWVSLDDSQVLDKYEHPLGVLSPRLVMPGDVLLLCSKAVGEHMQPEDISTHLNDGTLTKELLFRMASSGQESAHLGIAVYQAPSETPEVPGSVTLSPEIINSLKP